MAVKVAVGSHAICIGERFIHRLLMSSCLGGGEVARVDEAAGGGRVHIDGARRAAAGAPHRRRQIERLREAAVEDCNWRLCREISSSAS